MELSSLSRRRHAYTDQYPFVSGEYSVGDEKVPYFSISMTIREADQYLRLARELAFNDREPVNLEELFQRAVDEDRAAGPITTYLLQHGSLKFFNSFTVVLLPVDHDHSSSVTDTYIEDPDPPEDEPNPGLARRSIGPVQIDDLPNSDIGFIRWSTKRAKAVILDGQHRFLALKKILDSSQASLLRPEETKIPVLLLVLDPRAGFLPPQDQSTVLQACRSIFVALNKHAVPVSKTRTYLLDDQDLISVSMRRLLSSHVGGPLEGAGERAGRIPLALVDWHSDQAKFDRGLYLTSVIGLHETIRQVYPPRRDETDYEGLAEFIGRVSALVSPSSQSRWSELDLRAKVKRAEHDDLPFSFSTEEVSAAADSFARGLGQAIVRPLLRLRPYEELRARYEEAGFIGGSRELWLGFDKSGKQAYEARTGEQPSEEAIAIADTVKAGNLAFAVVFQRGLLLSAVRFDIARSEFKDGWKLSPSRFSVLDAWIDRVNERIVPFLKIVDFWLGAGIGNDRNVNFTKSGANGVKGLVSLAVLCDIEALRHEASLLAHSSSLEDHLSDSDKVAWELIVEPKSPYLRDDRFMAEAAPRPMQMAAYKWLAEQYRLISPGPASSLQVALTREACIDFRNSSRAYIRNELKATGSASPSNADLVMKATLVLAARRLAIVAAQSES
ncbi:DNA sulfur modification protein DndB [Sphaerisporangium flaviroseum]|uniref:DNA sulfur modification protein DndB n=1 Tax=Sphaerisporangium flaviroseum TaxID=509199 RepID=UPI0031F0BEDB